MFNRKNCLLIVFKIGIRVAMMIVVYAYYKLRKTSNNNLINLNILKIKLLIKIIIYN